MSFVRCAIAVCFVEIVYGLLHCTVDLCWFVRKLYIDASTGLIFIVLYEHCNNIIRSMLYLDICFERYCDICIYLRAKSFYNNIIKAEMYL